MDLKSHEREEISVEKEISSSPVFCTEEFSYFHISGNLIYEKYLVEYCGKACLKLSWNAKWSLESDTRHALKSARQVKFDFFCFCKFEFGVLGT